MKLDYSRCRPLLQKGDLSTLFIEEIGWDHASGATTISIGGRAFEFTTTAAKRGVVALECKVSDGKGMPTHPERRKLDREVTKLAHEHIIIYTDKDKSSQIWQWVKREAGKPAANREIHFNNSQSGDLLLQKLDSIAVSLEEEEDIGLTDISRRMQAAFDVEKVTKKFYEQFRKEHESFLGSIKGIGRDSDQEWYASVLLNRLMFVYFIQQKGFLDGDREYLKTRMAACKEGFGKNQFYSFYRYFLLRLFHEGLGRKERNKELDALLGKIPYLNGGMFEKHSIELTYGDDIQIPDKAFERIFAYFDQYDWHLDDRPLRSDKDINPDVLGFIFEKYINQKQMGAYYTKEDITGYIGNNTILPHILDAARKSCSIAFENKGGVTVWDLLKSDPDRYIYPAVLKGIDIPLPSVIGKGINPPTLKKLVSAAPAKTLELREDWKHPASEAYALPTETWREVVARRERGEELRQKLTKGEVRSTHDLTTLNLNIWQFTLDVIENCEGPELLRAIWNAIIKMTILDPTCGSGAFLFAALNILEPLYEACLDRMGAFVADMERAQEKHRPEKFSDFHKVLEQVGAHPSPSYFIYKSIILNNLYGVDIMEEAVEICKLRLFLKLAAQVESDTTKPNLGIEALPDIDFNVRAGNTLVGYATEAEVKTAVCGETQATMDFDGDWPRIQNALADAQQSFDAFREAQLSGDGSTPASHKKELEKRLAALCKELDERLAADYDVPHRNKAAFERWLTSNQPFHWFVQFYGIMNGGGFDVIIGNPPYVETSKIKGYRPISYKTGNAGNLYALCVERASALLQTTGHMGVIVPLSGFSTERMSSYQDIVWGHFNSIALSFYSGDAHPSVLFDGVKYRLCIVIATNTKSQRNNVFATDYLRWYADERPELFTSKLSYSNCGLSTGFLRFAKLGTQLAEQIISKLLSNKPTLDAYLCRSGTGHVTYHRSPVFWIRSMDFEPYFKSPSKTRSTDHLKDLYFQDVTVAQKAGGFLNSSLFYFWFTVQGNCRNIAGPDIANFPVGVLANPHLKTLTKLFSELMADLRKNSKRRIYVYEAAGEVEYDEFYPDRSKPIIDRIDALLAKHYGFTEEELDFILNYDIKYRMGREAKR